MTYNVDKNSWKVKHYKCAPYWNEFFQSIWHYC